MNGATPDAVAEWHGIDEAELTPDHVAAYLDARGEGREAEAIVEGAADRARRYRRHAVVAVLVAVATIKIVVALAKDEIGD